MTSTAVAEARPASPVAAFRAELDKTAPQFAAALPPHIPPERFARVVMTAVQGSPDLLQADRKSLFSSSMKAAQDGLLPDGRDGALVVYNTKAKDGSWTKQVQWMPMIGGILKRIRNSGELKSISAHVVYTNDKFAFVLGDDERIEHEPALEDRGKPRAVYAIAHTKDGGIWREVMTVQEVEQVRAVSRAANSGPWTQWWGEMARKTVLRRLAKRLPLSSDLDDLIRRDDALYQFDGKGAQAEAGERLFRPVANPLADTIEHEPSAALISPTPGAVDADGEAGPQPVSPDPRPRGWTADEAAADRDSGAAPPDSPVAADQGREAPDPAALETARLLGADAAKKGKARMPSIPARYRGQTALISAYLDGFDAERGPPRQAAEHEPGAEG
jgi:recombination protein RecT